mmetsp:Transcript_43793/g.133269  ORF Transcript_43793/g.133269 Transcript_43793/m.133269 type:complete len:201 (-) Transcript_43793:376-978(-)
MWHQRHPPWGRGGAAGGAPRPSRAGKGGGEREKKKKSAKRSPSRSRIVDESGVGGSRGDGNRRFRGGGGGGFTSGASIDPDGDGDGDGFLAIPPDTDYDLNQFLGKDNDSDDEGGWTRRYDRLRGAKGSDRLYFYRLAEEYPGEETRLGGDKASFVGRDGLAPRWTDPTVPTSRHDAVRTVLKDLKMKEKRRSKDEAGVH